MYNGNTYTVCGRIHQELLPSPLLVTVNCISPLIGDAVHIEKVYNTSTVRPYLNMCEVQVTGYLYEGK